MRQHSVTKRGPSAFPVIALAALGLAILPAPFQTGGQQTQKPIQVQTNLVNLFVTVRDHHNAIVTTLKKEDFHIYEDNVEQKVAYFSNDVSMPITMGLLMDTSGSEQATLPAEQEAAISFMSEVMRKGDLSMVMSFDTDVDLLADFTEDKAVIDRAIRRTQINAPSGATGPLGHQRITGTAFYDAVYLAAHDQLADQAGRKAIIAATDADDQGSKLNIQDAIEAAQRADAVIHILLVYDPYFGADAGGAEKMASETGGRMVEVRNEKSLQKAFDTISEELRHQYVLGYYPSNTARDGSFRKIKVEVSAPDMKTLTRKGYYAPTN